MQYASKIENKMVLALTLRYTISKIGRTYNYLVVAPPVAFSDDVVTASR